MYCIYGILQTNSAQIYTSVFLKSIHSTATTTLIYRNKIYVYSTREALEITSYSSVAISNCLLLVLPI